MTLKPGPAEITAFPRSTNVIQCPGRHLTDTRVAA